MGMFSKRQPGRGGSTSSSLTAAERQNQGSVAALETGVYDDTPRPFITWRVVAMGILVSMGGLIFGKPKLLSRTLRMIVTNRDVGYDTGEVDRYPIHGALS